MKRGAAFMPLAKAPSGGVLFVTALGLRIFTAGSNHLKLTGKIGPALLAPIKDLFSAFIWALSFGGNQIIWRGERFRVDRGGKLTRVA